MKLIVAFLLLVATATAQTPVNVTGTIYELFGAPFTGEVRAVIRGSIYSRATRVTSGLLSINIIPGTYDVTITSDVTGYVMKDVWIIPNDASSPYAIGDTGAKVASITSVSFTSTGANKVPKTSGNGTRTFTESNCTIDSNNLMNCAGGFTSAGSGVFLDLDLGTAGTAGCAKLYGTDNATHTDVCANASGVGIAATGPITGPVIEPGAIGADQNDYSPTGYATASHWYLTSDAARSITGIGGGFAGREIVICNNNASFAITLTNNDAASLAANRIVNPLGTGILMAAGACSTLVYDSASGTVGWREKSNKVGYTILFGNAGTFSPASTTVATYYIGHPATGAQSSATLKRMYIPRAGLLKAVYGQCTYANTPSTENISLYFRLNNSADTTITTTWSIVTANISAWSATGLSTAVAAGDYFEIKIGIPSMTTAPSTIVCLGNVYIE